jgi:hypothetical protein
MTLEAFANHIRSNEITCPCGTHYFHICGQQIEAGGGDPFEDRRGCPRFNWRKDPGVQYDDPDLNPENLDAHHFEALSRSASQQWMDASAQIEAADIQGRTNQAGDFQLGLEPNEQEDWYNDWMKRLLIAARHMSTMLSNGIDFGGVHATNFRFALDRLRRRFGEDFQLPGGNKSYRLLALYSRALRFQHGAVPNEHDVRQQEWTSFREVVEDQLNVQYPLGYLPEASSQSAGELRRAMWARSLLEPVLVMLTVIARSDLDYRRTTFTLPDSATLRT